MNRYHRTVFMGMWHFALAMRQNFRYRFWHWTEQTRAFRWLYERGMLGPRHVVKAWAAASKRAQHGRLLLALYARADRIIEEES